MCHYKCPDPTFYFNQQLLLLSLLFGRVTCRAISSPRPNIEGRLADYTAINTREEDTLGTWSRNRREAHSSRTSGPASSEAHSDTA